MYKISRASVPSLVVMLTASVMLFSCKKDKGDGDTTEPPKEDPKEVVAKEEKFEKDNKFFGLYSSADYEMKIENDRYSFTVKSKEDDLYYVWSPTEVFAAADKKQAIEVSVTHDKGNESDDFGLLFNVTDNDNYYSFNINHYGSFAIFKKKAGKEELLGKWTESTEIKKALKAENKLRVVLQDNKFRFLINGKEVHTIDAAGVTVLNKVGVSVYKGEKEVTKAVTYSVDYIKFLKFQ